MYISNTHPLLFFTHKPVIICNYLILKVELIVSERLIVMILYAYSFSKS